MLLPIVLSVLCCKVEEKKMFHFHSVYDWWIEENFHCSYHQFYFIRHSKNRKIFIIDLRLFFFFAFISFDIATNKRTKIFDDTHLSSIHFVFFFWLYSLPKTKPKIKQNQKKKKKLSYFVSSSFSSSILRMIESKK